jgi:hypothetical protein
VGYDVHVTRRSPWFAKDGLEISLDEWIVTVKSDPEMRLDGVAEASTPSADRLRYESEGLAVWTGYPDRRGRVVVKNPDQRALRKMWSVAQGLSAKVEGHEGETTARTAIPLHEEN